MTFSHSLVTINQNKVRGNQRKESWTKETNHLTQQGRGKEGRKEGEEAASREEINK